MKNKRPAASATLYSPRATLCAIGIRLRSLKLFDTIADHVKVKQKTIKHTPAEKLTDAFIAILAGAHGLREINTRVRSDAALQRAFGRSSCAEQSVVQETLDACDAENVRQMKRAFKALTRAHSRAYRHPYKARLQLLDVDMTGLPCGRQGERTSKGYFANKPGRHGRQMARVCATHYEEVVLDWVGPGNVQLNKVLRIDWRRQHQCCQLVTAARLPDPQQGRLRGAGGRQSPIKRSGVIRRESGIPPRRNS